MAYATTTQLAGETASRKSADADLDARLDKVEAWIRAQAPVAPVEPPVTPPVTPPTQPPVSPPVTPTSGVYGSGVAGDSRANLQVGFGNSARLDYRFRAGVTGQATGLRVQQRGGPIYSGGNGGRIRASVQSDSGGLPSGTPLASLTWSPGNPAGGWEVWTLLSFATPLGTVAGTLYHIVFENLDAAQTTNYISLNMLFTFGATTTPRHAAYSDDFATFYAEPSTWKLKANNLPIFDLVYADGRHEGQGYIGTMWDKQATISGTANMARERFTVTGSNRTVSRAHVRVKRISGTGPLVLTLEAADGTPIDKATVPASAIAVGSVPDGSAGSLAGDTWAHGTFGAAHTLVAGQTYYLRLSTDASTRYNVVPIQEGTPKGLLSRRFTDGDGQRGVAGSGGMAWSNLYPYDPADLQFWLD